MHDHRVLREQIDLLRDGMRRRGALETYASAIDRGDALDRERRSLIQSVEEKKAQRNASAATRESTAPGAAGAHAQQSRTG